jgi:two-component system LytT family sensor kinase
LAWSKEVAFHHAGLPLALLVLLQDFRFLLLDAFLRFIVNGTLAAAAILLSIRVLQTPQLKAHLRDPFRAGLLFVGASILLTLFVYVRNRTQSFLTRVIFLRSNIDDALQELVQLARGIGNEHEYLRCAAEVVARFFRTSRFELSVNAPSSPGELIGPAGIDNGGGTPWSWVQAVLPVRFSRGDTTYLLLGPRDGSRRYLSEDFVLMARLAAAVVEHVEQLRSHQMQTLVSQAELKALQAQINPHFLFNSLNTLYGTIDRNNSEARRLVLDLADIFRYLLRPEQTLVELQEELRIVRAYLEIEKLRLGPKLRTELEIEEEVLHLTVPLLSIQPLVENAVKHGVASRQGPGFVRLTAAHVAEGLTVEVTNSGVWAANAVADLSGIGLTNVRRRLELCYGPRGRFSVCANGGVTTVGFAVPIIGTRPGWEIPATA